MKTKKLACATCGGKTTKATVITKKLNWHCWTLLGLILLQSSIEFYSFELEAKVVFSRVTVGKI